MLNKMKFVNKIFSDEFKLLKIITPLFIILIVVFYGEIKGPQIYPGYLEAVRSPELYLDKEIGFGGKITKIEEKYILVKINKKEVIVNLSLPKDKLNYNIAGMAVFNKNQDLEPIKYHLSNLRQYKIFLSLIPFVTIVYLFFKKYHA